MKVIVDLAGGLGNQLFCYSFGYAVSRKTGSELILDTSMQDNGIARELELFNFNVNCSRRISYLYKTTFLDRALFNKVRKKRAIGVGTQIYKEKEPTIYEPEVFDVGNDTYFKGNWQSEKYFLEYREELLDLFVPVYERNDSVKKLIYEMQKSNSVAIHIRRGDYVKIGCELPMIYYDKAIETIIETSENDNLIFYVFSDDVLFSKQYLESIQEKNGIKYCFAYPEYQSDNRTLDDLLLMSCCKHMIMANSSYSWWAAWLNKNKNKIVVCPEFGMWSGDFYPEEWEKIACD